jgi:hypothetical protein
METTDGDEVNSANTEDVLTSLRSNEPGLMGFGFGWAKILLYNNIHESGRIGGVANAIDGLKDLTEVIFQFNSLLAGFQMISLVGIGEPNHLYRLTIFTLILGFIASSSGCILSLIILKYLILARDDTPSFAIGIAIGLSPMIICYWIGTWPSHSTLSHFVRWPVYYLPRFC